MSAQRGRHVALAGCAAFLLVAALVRMANYRAPLAGDATQFLYVGHAVAHGGMPYVDAAYSKGPLTALLFALIEPLAGTSTTVVRLSAVPFAAGAALALAAYVAHHAGRVAGAIAGLAFAAFSALPGVEGAEAKTETYGVAPAFGALWLATRPGRAAAAGAGALLVCAILINPAFAAFAPAAVVELWLATPRGERARRLGAAVAGALAPAAAIAIWLVAGGALDDMLRQVGGQVKNAVGSGPPLADHGARRGVAPISHHVPEPALWVLAGAGFLLAMRDPRLRRPALGLALVAAAVVLRIKLATYGFDYHYYPALPALCGAIALGVVAVVRVRPRVQLAAAAVVLAIPLWTLVVHPQLRLLRDEPAARNPYGASVYPVAAFLRAHTRARDRIIVEGGRAEVYWVAQRRAPTRFFDAFGPTSDTSYPAERRRDLMHRPPAAVVVMATERLSADAVLAHLVATRGYVRAYARAGSSVWLRTRPA